MVICVKAFGVSLMFIMLSSYSHLITHVRYFTTCSPFHYAVHKSTKQVLLFIKPSLHLFKFYPLGKMENFTQLDCFSRQTTLTVVPSLSIDDNLVIKISGVPCKKTTLRSRITGGSNKQGGGGVKYHKWGVGISVQKKCFTLFKIFCSSKR